MGKKRFALGLLVAAAFLALFFYKTDFAEMGRILAQANYWYMLPALGIYSVSIVFRTLRWQYLMRPVKPLSFRTVLSFLTIGYMANNLLPARGGELVRTYILGEKEGISKISILATIALERVFDGLALLTFAALALPWVPLVPWLQDVLRYAGIVFVGGIVVLIWMSMRPHTALRLADMALRLLPDRFGSAGQGLVHRFLEGMQTLTSLRAALAVFGLTVLAWVCEGSTYYVVGLGFGIQRGVMAPVLMTATANLATAVPASQGGIGPFEYFASLSLQLFGVDPEVAKTYTLVLHALLLVPITLLGLYYLWRENLSLARLASERKTLTATEPLT